MIGLIFVLSMELSIFIVACRKGNSWMISQNVKILIKEVLGKCLLRALQLLLIIQGVWQDFHFFSSEVTSHL